MKTFWSFILFSSAFVLANEICAGLCGPCALGNSDSTCVKVDSLCHCAAVLDSISAIKTEDQDVRLAAESTLVAAFERGCEEKFCGFYVKLEKDSVRIENIPVRLPEEKAELYKDSAETPNAVSEEQLLSLSGECQRFCSFCPEEKSADSNCIRIEDICGCRAFVEQQKRLQEAASRDSIAQVEAFLMRKENAQMAADSVLNRLRSSDGEELFLTLFNRDLSLVDMRNSATEKKPDADTATSAIILLSKETGPRRGDSLKVIIPEEKKEPAGENVELQKTPQKSDRTLYPGLMFYAGSFEESSLMGLDLIKDATFTAGLGFFLRSYFYKFYEYGSFQFGLNAVYNYAEYDADDCDGGIVYHNVGAEMPLQFRFGFPIGKYIAPYLSYAFVVRKPIYVWTEWYLENERYSYSYGYYSREESDSPKDAYKLGDWEFLGFFGMGLEVVRYFSIEWQMVIHSTRTYEDEPLHPYDESWRVKLEVAF